MNTLPCIRKPMAEVLMPICPGCGRGRTLGEFERVGDRSWCQTCIKDALAIIIGSWDRGDVPQKQTKLNTDTVFRNRSHGPIYWQEPVRAWKRTARWTEDGRIEWEALEPVTRVETITRYC